MKNLLVLIIMVFVSFQAMGQQDPMFTKYMFNSLHFNPAYAGSHEHLSLALLHRTQWINFQGAPNTQTFTAHTPLRENRVGVGLSLLHDQIGVTRTSSANLSYAYRIPLSKKARLSVGIQGGMTNWRADWNKLELENTVDPAFDGDVQSKWLPNFGFGLYFQTKRFYTGLSSPHLIEHKLRESAGTVESALVAQQYRHYYFTVGGAIPIVGDDIIFKPSLLVKNVGIDSKLRKTEDLRSINAPTEFDVDLSVLFMETLWVGAAFRSSIEKFSNDKSSFDSGDIWASYNLRNGMRIGAAYDYTLTEINKETPGSFEIMLGYEFDFKTNRIETPRYF